MAVEVVDREKTFKSDKELSKDMRIYYLGRLELEVIKTIPHFQKDKTIPSPRRKALLAETFNHFMDCRFSRPVFQMLFFNTFTKEYTQLVRELNAQKEADAKKI